MYPVFVHFDWTVFFCAFHTKMVHSHVRVCNQVLYASNCTSARSLGAQSHAVVLTRSNDRLGCGHSTALVP